MKRSAGKQAPVDWPRPSTARIERSKLRLFGVAVLCLKVALIPLVFDQSFDIPFTVPRVLLSHALAYVLVAVILALVVRYGRDFLTWSWLHVAVVAFFLANVVASLLAADTALALYGTHGRMLGLGTIADGVSLYFAVALINRTRREAVAVVACALGASLVVLGYELIQLVGRDPLDWQIDGSINPFSTLGQPTTLAFYLTVVAVGAWALAAFAAAQTHIRAALLLYSAALLAGSAATGTRSAILGLALGGALLVVLLWIRTSSQKARVVTAIGVASATAALAALILLSPLAARLSATIQLPGPYEAGDDSFAVLDPSTSDRVVLYGIALRMVQDRPLFGWGPDNFAAGMSNYRPAGIPIGLRQPAATSAHSWAAQIATSSGLAGLGAFLAMIAIALTSAIRRRDHAIALVGAVTIAGYLGTGLTTISDIATDALLWLSVGAIAAVTARPLVSTEPVSPRRPARAAARDKGKDSQLRRTAAWSCVAVSLLPVFATINALDASRATNISQNSRLIGNVGRAVEFGLRATRSDPGRPTYWHHLGLAYVAGGRFREASVAFDRAHQLAPYDTRYTTDLISAHIILAGNGDAQSRAIAVGLADQAVEADPNNPLAQLARATAMQSTGNLAEALKSAERALALDPQSLNLRLYITATQIYLDTGHPADAFRVAQEGLAIFDRVEVSARAVPLRYELARALGTLGRTSEAIAQLDIVLSVQPNHAAAQLLRSQLRAQVRN